MCSYDEEDENCQAPVTARGWCRKHYLRWYRLGTPSGSAIVRRRRPHGLSIDECIAYYMPNPVSVNGGCLEGWAGDCNDEGRPRLSHGGRQRYVAAWICELKHGPPPGDGYHASHACDNNKCLTSDHIFWEPGGVNVSRSHSVAALLRIAYRRDGLAAVKAGIKEFLTEVESQ